MRQIFLLIAIGLPLLTSGLAWPADEFLILAYHDICKEVADDPRNGKTAVSASNLAEQFDWLKKEAYHVISIDDLLEARAGGKHLPDKAVLLSFDDGYASFFDVALPLLKQYRYPAVLAVVGCWMEPPQSNGIPCHGEVPPRQSLLTWEQIKVAGRSGLVEIASHSYDLHHGVLGNPQGNLQPAGVTRIYDPLMKAYETDAAYRQRIRREIKSSSDSIFSHTGKRPRVMVWPYGEANQFLIQEANKQGMTVTFGLSDGRNSITSLTYVRRLLVVDDPPIEDFAKLLQEQRINDRPLRVAHVDLDYVHDPDPVQTERNLGLLLDRIQAMGANTVFLQAFSDPDGDGNADGLYFPNRHLPMTADLFNRVAWQLLTRTRVKAYAWMPVLAFKIERPESWFVHEWRDAKYVEKYSIPRLAQISDETLNQHYGYGLSKPGTFGYKANEASAAYAAKVINTGETAIERIAEAIHDGWSSIARTYEDPQYKQNPDKRANRLKLASMPYAALTEDEKEKDRVVARALLKTLKGPMENRLFEPDKIYLSRQDFQRLSPFNPAAKRLIGEIYEDLAKHCQFAGILFNDDAILSDYEDVSPQALHVVGEQWKLPTRQKQLRDDPSNRLKWAKHKTQALIELTGYLAGIVRQYHPDIKTARNYYALPILQPESEEWHAQSLVSGLAAYDYVAIEAMPYMEKAEHPVAWLETLVKKVAQYSDGLRKSIFELQTVDWNTGKKIPMDSLLMQFKLIQDGGGFNLGYYPDNMHEDHPRLKDMESAFALPIFP